MSKKDGIKKCKYADKILIATNEQNILTVFKAPACNCGWSLDEPNDSKDERQVKWLEHKLAKTV